MYKHFWKKFNKDKNINSLVQEIKNKEKDLSEAKAICDEYNQKIIKNHREPKQLDNEKKEYIQFNRWNYGKLYHTNIWWTIERYLRRKNNKSLTKTRSKTK